jgi:hypothetical protein
MNFFCSPFELQVIGHKINRCSGKANAQVSVDTVYAEKYFQDFWFRFALRQLHEEGWQRTPLAIP